MGRVIVVVAAFILVARERRWRKVAARSRESSETRAAPSCPASLSRPPAPRSSRRLRAAVTDEAGRYNIVNLRPGTYAVTFTLPGFSTVKHEGIELTASFTATVNAEMRVGSLEETHHRLGETSTVDVQNVIAAARHDPRRHGRDSRRHEIGRRARRAHPRHDHQQPGCRRHAVRLGRDGHSRQPALRAGAALRRHVLQQRRRPRRQLRRRLDQRRHGARGQPRDRRPVGAKASSAAFAGTSSRRTAATRSRASSREPSPTTICRART